MNAITIAEAGIEYEDAPIGNCETEWAAFQNAIHEALRAATGNDLEITHIGGSMGSQYFDVGLPGRETVCVRISNHKRGINGESTPVWSFETKDVAKLHALGIAEVVQAVMSADEID